jgi:hypothetical protein
VVEALGKPGDRQAPTVELGTLEQLARGEIDLEEAERRMKRRK